MPSTNLYCSLQNRLGAMDRVLMAFTHRGIIPSQLYVEHNEAQSLLEVSITFQSNDDKALQKLVKSLQCQVYVIDVRLIGREAGSVTNFPFGGTKSDNAKEAVTSGKKSAEAKTQDATMSIAAISA